MPPDDIASSRWTGRESPAEPRFQLPETPFIFGLDPDGNESGRVDGGSKQPDIFGQKAAVDTLTDLCLQALGRRLDGTAGERRAATIALYGRYGQGKTTVLTGVRRVLDPDPGGTPSAVRCAEFDVTDHRPDQMAYDFDRLVSEWSLRTRGLHYGIVVAVLTGVVALSERFGVAWGFASAVLVPWLIKPVGDALRAASNEGLLARRLESLWRFDDRSGISRLWQSLSRGRPDVLIVDNLDRATVDQQRAFLRSLRRHRRNLPTVVIVAFDETPLALSDPNPEAPQELLAKVFTTTVRLYPMTVADVVGIVTHLHDRLQAECGADARNPLRFLRYPAVAGDLARILLAHRRHSVRFCYQFLNTAATASATLRIDHPADFSALMRLQGLFEFLPWIRHDPWALADMIARNDADALLAHAAGILGKDRLSGELAGAVTAYLVLTNHMQPYFADWQTFTGRFGLRAPELADDDAAMNGETAYWFPGPSMFSDHGAARGFWMEWVEWDLKVAAERNLGRRRLLYEEAIHRPRPDDARAGHRLALSFLVHRLWFGDHEAARRSPAPADRELLLAVGETSDREISLTIEERNAFLQITRSAADEVMPFFEAIIASGTFRPGKLGGASDGERRRLNALERRAPARVRGGWPTLFGKPLFPSDRAFHVAGALDQLDVPVDPKEFDWKSIRRRIDTLGRLQRANCSGIMVLIESFIDRAIALHRNDAAVMKEFLWVMAAAFPAFDSIDDGRWQRQVFDHFAPLAVTLFGMASTFPTAKLLRGVSNSPIAPHILLMTLHFGVPKDTVAPLATFGHFEALISRWQPPDRWPVSYLACLASIVEDIKRSAEITGCDAHRAMRHTLYLELIKRVSKQLDDDPLDHDLRDALVPPPLP